MGAKEAEKMTGKVDKQKLLTMLEEDDEFEEFETHGKCI